MALSTIRGGIDRYTEFIKTNPLVANEIESALRWFSYLTAASKYSKSQVVSELLYSSASLLQLLNDAILRKAAHIKLHVDVTIEHLQTLLTVLEYTSVFSEFTGNRFAGDVGKWIIIAVFQIAKAVIKLLLLLKYNQGLQKQTPILPLDRRSDLICLQRNHNHNLNNNQRDRERELQRERELEVEVEGRPEPEPEAEASSENNEKSTVTLKRSGRVMRTIDKAPPRSQRTWMLPTIDPLFREAMDKNRKDAPPSALDDHQVLGELLHILRPVAHLTAVAGFGPQAWFPFLLSAGMDAASLKLLSDPPNKAWNVRERVELGQRSFALLLYLLRSPFYDRFTKERILNILRLFSDNIPLFGRLVRPLVDYLPEWQRTYFYVWGV